MGGEIPPATVPTATPQSNTSTGPNINLTINDLSGSGNAVKDLHFSIMSDGVKNLTICLGHHGQIMNPSITSTIGSSASIPGLPSSSNLDTSLTGRECSGFPTGYFRIRAAGTQHYWTVTDAETSHEGNALHLWKDVPKAQAFYLNARGELCAGGSYIDVIDNTLIIAHNRPPTLPWPNPWSHPLPTFSYSKETKAITVAFYADPLILDQWPRPEKEWKDREFLVAARSMTAIRIPHFNKIARWALNSKFIRWTARAGHKWEAGVWDNLGVEEYTGVAKSGDADRIRWEIELV